MKDKDKILEMALKHHLVTPDHISKALDHARPYIRQTAIQHPSANAEHISKALSDINDLVRTRAMTRSS